MVYEFIEVENIGNVGVVRLNRPEKLNAWNAEMGGEVRNAIETFNNDPAVGAIVTTGNGRAFCAGADISGWSQDLAGEREWTPVERSTEEENWIDFCTRSKPLIAAVHGYAVGIGATQVLPYDLRLACENVRFSFRFVRVGLLPELGSTALLPRLIGLGRAVEACMTARDIEAEEALRIGLVTEVIPESSFFERVLEVAESIAANPTAQLIQAKELFAKNIVEPDFGKVMRLEGEALGIARESAEHREAVQAFLEKREPNFR
mgnify:FL=1